MVPKPEIIRPNYKGSDKLLDKVALITSGDCRRYALRSRTLMLIESKDRHEIKNTGRKLLRTLNFYVPPAYTMGGDELPAGKPEK